MKNTGLPEDGPVFYVLREHQMLPVTVRTVTPVVTVRRPAAASRAQAAAGNVTRPPIV